MDESVRSLSCFESRISSSVRRSAAICASTFQTIPNSLYRDLRTLRTPPRRRSSCTATIGIITEQRSAHHRGGWHLFQIPKNLHSVARRHPCSCSCQTQDNSPKPSLIRFKPDVYTTVYAGTAQSTTQPTVGSSSQLS